LSLPPPLLGPPSTPSSLLIASNFCLQKGSKQTVSCFSCVNYARKEGFLSPLSLTAQISFHVRCNATPMAHVRSDSPVCESNRSLKPFHICLPSRTRASHSLSTRASVPCHLYGRLPFSEVDFIRHTGERERREPHVCPISDERGSTRRASHCCARRACCFNNAGPALYGLRTSVSLLTLRKQVMRL